MAPDEKIDGKAALVARRAEFRWSWLATRLHFFVVALCEPDLSTDRAEMLTAAAQEYAIAHKGGLLRGLQTGTATLPTFLCRAPSADVKKWFEKQPQQRYAAVQIPVLADLESRRLTWFSGRLHRGFIYQADLHRIIRDVLAPGLDCAAAR